MFRFIEKWVYWPTLNDELVSHRDYLSGRVLNAGCGSRIIELPKVEEMVSFDIQDGPNIDIVGSLEKMPFENGEFDGILNIAVLEHCEHPWLAVLEMARILKSGGRMICCVPFMQPIHNYPGDYYRFTPQGILSLLKNNGFKVNVTEYTHSCFHVWGWFMEDLVKDKSTFLNVLLLPVSKVNYLLSKVFPNFNISTAPSVITLLAEKNSEIKSS